MRLSLRATCFVVACASTALVALLTTPSGCGVQEVLIAQAGPDSDAGDASIHPDGAPSTRDVGSGDSGSYEGSSDATFSEDAGTTGDAGSPCSTEHEGGAPCVPDVGTKSCDGGGIGAHCFDEHDAHSRTPPEEAGAGPPCSSNDDCKQPAEFCAKVSCKDTAGECESRPVECDNVDESVVCGCDGVAYWNDCLRKREGVTSSLEGECTSPAFCAGGTLSEDGGIPPPLCPSNAYCFVQGCDGGTVGVCWVPPDTCPDASAKTWRSCEPTYRGCIDLCNAITSNHPFTLGGPACP